MRSKRRRLPDFEACSLVLFTLLTAASLNARAQGPQLPPGHASASKPPVTVTTPATASATHIGAVNPQHASASTLAANLWTSERIDAAFRRTDTNSDGLISAREAREMPALARRFMQIDANNDHVISSAEFSEALK